MHAVRDSKDLVTAAFAQKHLARLGHADSQKFVSPQMVKFVAFAIGSFMNKEGIARVGVPTLQERFRLTPQTVRLAVRVIAAAGWWRVTPGGGAKNTNVYTAQIPAHAEFYKTGCRDTPFDKPVTGVSAPETGCTDATKRFEVENPPGGKEPSHARPRPRKAAPTQEAELDRLFAETASTSPTKEPPWA
jgi:hypothetical protein